MTEPPPVPVHTFKATIEDDDPRYETRLSVHRRLKRKRAEKPDSGNQLQLFQSAPGGFTKAPNALLTGAALNLIGTTAGFVYLELRRREYGPFKPATNADLAGRLGFRVETIRRAVTVLIACGMIQVKSKEKWTGRTSWSFPEPCQWIDKPPMLRAQVARDSRAQVARDSRAQVAREMDSHIVLLQEPLSLEPGERELEEPKPSRGRGPRNAREAEMFKAIGIETLPE